MTVRKDRDDWKEGEAAAKPRLFIICADCLMHSNAMFLYAKLEDRIQVVQDVRECKYREAMIALCRSDPFHIADIVEARHQTMIRAGHVKLGP